MNDRTIEINFHFFDLNLTSYNDRGAKNSSSLLKEVFHLLTNDRKEDKVHIFDRKQGESNDDKRNLLIFSSVFTTKGVRLKGKMALLRNKLPVFLNNRSDIDEIENIKDKRLAEITHFIIDFSGNVPLIMFEFNNSGPRISDFEYYIRQVSKDSHIAKYCNASLRVKGEIGEILKKLKNVFEIDMKVRQENFHFLKDIDHKFYSSVVALNESYPYESFRISTSYSKKKTNIGGLSLGRRILDYFGKNGLRLEQVEDLKMTVDRGNGAEPLDLITQKENVLLILPLSSPGRPDSRILFENAIEEMNTFMLK